MKYLIQATYEEEEVYLAYSSERLGSWCWHWLSSGEAPLSLLYQITVEACVCGRAFITEQGWRDRLGSHNSFRGHVPNDPVTTL